MSDSLNSSRIADFYRLSIDGRINALAARGLIDANDAKLLLQGVNQLPLATADKMIENVIGVFGLPFAVVPDFLLNDRDYIVPMVVEEPSIVAGVSGAAKLFRGVGGLVASASESLLIGQIQIVDVDDADGAIRAMHEVENDVLKIANDLHPNLLARGGGAREVEYFKFRLQDGRWTVVLHLLVDTCNAMGANIVNTMCEGVAEYLENVCSGRVCLRILSNLADRAVVTASISIPYAALDRGAYSGEEIRNDIVLANDFANADPHRAATHNKGIMNGVDAVAIATGNDWRALEAGAHAYAVRDGAYRPMTKWSIGGAGELLGELNMPIKIGVVGGAQALNPAAAMGLRIAGVASSAELASMMGAVGLAQNFAALHALVTHGIQKGHMSLHARAVAANAGATDDIFDQVVDAMIQSGQITAQNADRIVTKLQNQSSPVMNSPPPDAVCGVAAGKVILLGEHAAVYDRRVLAVPLESAVTAWVARGTTGVRLIVPDWGIEEQLIQETPVAGGAAAVVRLIMRRLEISKENFDIFVQSRIPAAMGLGASASFAVAVIRAFATFLDRNMSNAEVDALAFECEKLAHGTPSGIDNNIATYSEPVLFSKGTGSRTRPLTLTETPPLVVAASNSKGLTKKLIAGVRSRFERNEGLYTAIFDEMDEISVAGAIALENSDYEQLGSLMNVCHGLLNAIEVSTPELEQMIDIARKSGAVGAKLTGAGGGGSIVALCPDKSSDVVDALRVAGFRIVHMTSDA